MINSFYFNKLYSNTEKDFFIYEQQPTLVRPVVTQSDAETGYLTRYFARLTNDESFIVEIDEIQYGKFQNNPRFVVTKVRWKIVGKKETYYLSSGVPVHGIVDINRQTVVNTDLTFGGLRSYIQDYGEFWFAENV